MITDIFSKRYEAPIINSIDDRLPKALEVFIFQAAQIVYDDIVQELGIPERVLKMAHDKVCREIGCGRLHEGKDYLEICGKFLTEPYDLWNNKHGTPDTYFKLRLSLLEMMLKEIEPHIDRQGDMSTDAKNILKFLSSVSKEEKYKRSTEDKKEYLRERINEFNYRLRSTNLPLHYHNGLIQVETDPLITDEVTSSFWELLNDKDWQNVDLDIKEAIDRRDNGSKDAAFYAMKALESTIKIVSDKRGWTSGRERGAANYIDNLVNKKNGRFIDPWEADMLKKLFTEIRNPLGHGAGTNLSPILSHAQTSWIIENSMIWIKSLIRRM